MVFRLTVLYCKQLLTLCSSIQLQYSGCVCAHSLDTVAVTDSVVVLELELLLVCMMNMQAQLMRLMEQKTRCIIRGYVLSNTQNQRIQRCLRSACRWTIGKQTKLTFKLTKPYLLAFYLQL